ncbi:hypothetical protein BV25DRAFT_851712 [Artomyces pyxidatus]|uniref:Uncharacterized protein n=1 Tax=Artomyces pyxidatus TaxID=48021 RepID=A0ACB8TH25_9AGAM|nr:hypothetical protein BV25DRAFT_851712 [Artomyces pyxidatus]
MDSLSNSGHSLLPDPETTTVTRTRDPRRRPNIALERISTTAARESESASGNLDLIGSKEFRTPESPTPSYESASPTEPAYTDLHVHVKDAKTPAFFANTFGEAGQKFTRWWRAATFGLADLDTMPRRSPTRTPPPEENYFDGRPSEIGPERVVHTEDAESDTEEEDELESVTDDAAAALPDTKDTSKAEDGYQILSESTRRLLYQPKGKWKDIMGSRPILDVKVETILGCGSWCTATLNTGCVQRETSEGKTVKEKLWYVSRSWNLKKDADWYGFHTELALYRMDKYLYHLQGVVVPRIMGVYAHPGKITVATEPPHPVFWIEASPSMPDVLKERVLDAFRQIHACGVVHNDVALRHILIGGDARVTIIDFQSSLADETDEFIGLHEASEGSKEKEMRRVKFILDYHGAQDKEREKTERHLARRSRNKQAALDRRILKDAGVDKENIPYNLRHHEDVDEPPLSVKELQCWSLRSGTRPMRCMTVATSDVEAVKDAVIHFMEIVRDLEMDATIDAAPSQPSPPSPLSPLHSPLGLSTMDPAPPAEPVADEKDGSPPVLAGGKHADNNEEAPDAPDSPDVDRTSPTVTFDRSAADDGSLSAPAATRTRKRAREVDDELPKEDWGKFMKKPRYFPDPARIASNPDPGHGDDSLPSSSRPAETSSLEEALARRGVLNPFGGAAEKVRSPTLSVPTPSAPLRRTVSLPPSPTEVIKEEPLSPESLTFETVPSETVDLPADDISARILPAGLYSEASSGSKRKRSRGDHGDSSDERSPPKRAKGTWNITMPKVQAAIRLTHFGQS